MAKGKRGFISKMFSVVGYLNGQKVNEGRALGRKEADGLSKDMQARGNSITVGIYNESGQLVKVKKPTVCRSGKRF